jgi:hypothetical protein
VNQYNFPGDNGFEKQGSRDTIGVVYSSKNFGNQGIWRDAKNTIKILELQGENTGKLIEATLINGPAP